MDQEPGIPWYEVNPCCLKGENVVIWTERRGAVDQILSRCQVCGKMFAR